MKNDPLECQMVQVKLEDRDWQAATYRRGQFEDIYGLPLDRRKISNWRALDESANSED